MNESIEPKSNLEMPDANSLLPPADSTPQSIVPKAPEGLAPEAEEKIRTEVATLAATTGKSLANRNFTIVLENLGRPEQELATRHIELIETRVNAIVRPEDGQADIPGAVSGMRKEIDKLNPMRAEQSSTGKFLANIPGGRSIFNFWLASGIRQVAMKREMIRDQIKGIKDGLMGSRDQMLGDNIQLNQLYDYVIQGAMSGIQHNAYFCELLLEQFQKMQDEMTPDDPRRSKLQRAIEIVTVRIRNMRLTENALQQGLATIDINIDGNRKIAESMEETAILTTNYLTIAMALYQALAHQWKAIQLLVKARQGTTDVMVGTSEMAKQSAETVSELYYNPVEELRKAEQAQGNLMAALQTLEDASRNGTIQSRQSIIKLTSMTAALRKKQAQLRAGHELADTSAR